MLPVLLALIAPPMLAPAQSHTTPQAARAVVRSYYAAIERGDFRTAYRMWDRDGQASGKSYATFRQGFAATAHSRVIAGPPVNGDSGMSQSWIDVPVEVFATLKNGRHQHFRGRYTLRRVAAGVSSNPAATRWHIAKARLVAIR